MFPYRLAAIDLDDTLLGPDKRISAANADAVHDLRRRGVRVVLASGRRHENMLRYHRELGLDGAIVSAQGALVKEADTGEVIFARFVPAAPAAEVLADGTARGVSQNFYRDDGVYVREKTPWTDLYQRRTGSELVVYGDLNRLAGESPQKIIWVMDAREVERLFPVMEGRYAGRLYVTVTDPEYLEFIAYGVNKAVGLAALAARYGIAREQVVAFGDGHNDVDMLRWAGLGVAMDHGRETAKSAAGLTAPPGDPETSFARAVSAVLARGTIEP